MADSRLEPLGDDDLPGDDPPGGGGDDLPGDDHGAGDDDLPGDEHGVGDDDPPGDDHGVGDDDPPGDDNGVGDDDPPADDHGVGDDDPPGDDHGVGDDDPPGDDHGVGDDDPPGDDNGGDDLFHGQGSDDVFDGGAGVDTVVLAGLVAQYAVVKSEDGAFHVSGEGSDVFIHVERLEFGDVKLAFDVDGAAGMTAKLVGALFGSEWLGNAAVVGAGLQLFGSGLGYQEVASQAMAAGSLDGLSDDSFVRLLYANVVGSNPDDATAAHFTGLLAQGVYTRESLAVLAAESELNALNVDLVGLGEHGIAYS